MSTNPSCETCGRSLGAPKPSGRRRRFCNASCRSKARRQRSVGQNGAPAARPFPTAVRAATAESGRSLRDLASQLEDAGYYLSPSTLSQWGRGHHLPRLDEAARDRLFMLERLASVPTGSLVRALHETTSHLVGRRTPVVLRPRRSGEPSGRRTFVDARVLLLQRIASLVGSDPDALAEVAHTEHYLIDRRRRPVRSEVTITVAAVTGMPDRYWHVHTHQAQAPVIIVAGHGCARGIALEDIRPVRVNSRTTYQLAATELRFDRPVAPGCEHTFSFTVCYGPGSADGPVPAAMFWPLVSTPAMRELRVSIAFDPAVRPRQLRRARWQLGSAEQQPFAVATIPVNEDGSSEPILASLPMPGWYGYQWDWELADP
jgi:hypothetical protein